MIDLDFKADWRAFIETSLRSLGLSYHSQESVWDNTLVYLNAQRRSLEQRPRSVWESAELNIPKGHTDQYHKLKSTIEGGFNLTGYLSTRSTSASFKDRLLNHWGIHHLHYDDHRPHRSKHVLFVHFEEKSAYVIQSKSHGKGHPHVWVDQELIQIIHDNWPNLLTNSILKEVVGETLPPDHFLTLRNNNANVAIQVQDGTTYIPFNNGVSSSGHSFLTLLSVTALRRRYEP